MEHLYTKKQAAQLRQDIIDSYIIPIVKANFDRHPQLKSIGLLVAQYWSDEANDAVHYQLIYSVLDVPNLEAAIIAQRGYCPDTVNLPEISSKYGELTDEIRFRYIKSDTSQYYWDDNYYAIPAFAAFCREGCHQEMEKLEAYSLYAIFRHSGDAIAIEVVGEMLRPWLDGVKPEEDGAE